MMACADYTRIERLSRGEVLESHLWDCRRGREISLRTLHFYLDTLLNTLILSLARMLLRVFRVTIDSHSAHFDDLDTVTQFIKGYLRKRESDELPEQGVTVESVQMDEEEYRRICDEEDGVAVTMDWKIT